MTKEEFTFHLNGVSLVALKFAERYVKDKLTTDFKYNVILNVSTDNESLTQFDIYPEDNGIIKLGLMEDEVIEFISKPLNLKEAMAVYLIQDLSLEKIKQFPFITAISNEKLSLLKLKIKEREKYLEDISQNLEMKKQMAIYIKNKMWLNSQCLLLGYKFPSNKNEDEFIISKIKE